MERRASKTSATSSVLAIAWSTVACVPLYGQIELWSNGATTAHLGGHVQLSYVEHRGNRYLRTR